MKIAPKIAISLGSSVLQKNCHGLLKRAQLAKNRLIWSPCITLVHHRLLGFFLFLTLAPLVLPILELTFNFFYLDKRSSQICMTVPKS